MKFNLIGFLQIGIAVLDRFLFNLILGPSSSDSVLLNKLTNLIYVIEVRDLDLLFDLGMDTQYKIINKIKEISSDILLFQFKLKFTISLEKKIKI